MNELRHSSRAKRLMRFSMLLGLFAAQPLQAAIQFEDVSQQAGIDHAGQSYGASWGDFNGDGWPDLWVGNHDSKPTLYLNTRDGSFENIIDRVWAANPHADTHGAAWADFDNDGDQDLVEVVGALQNIDGTFCFGCGLNHL
ncbi:MAG: VCBS repeat-containing protein, partial [Gammaproteobacteria bacterium]|nr:VCBS repeat-containing protein [Gammaproteobacteria bacterium]